MTNTLQILGLVLCLHCIVCGQPRSTAVDPGIMTDLVSKELGSEKANLIVSEYINKEWLPKGEQDIVYEDMVLNKIARVRVYDDGEFELLNNVKSLGKLLQTGYEQLPSSFEDRMLLIERIVELYVDYFGKIGSEKLYNSLERIAPIESWIKFKKKGDAEKFRNYCTSPLFQTCTNGGSWEAGFYVICSDGSVRKCVVKGSVKPMSLVSITITKCEDEGTYLFYKVGKCCRPN